MSIVVMVVGAFGPWVNVADIATIKGTDGGGDGWIVVGAAGVAALALVFYVRRWRSWILVLPLLAGVAGVATTSVDISELSDEQVYGDFQVAAGWGISVAFLASTSLAVSSTVLLIRRLRGRRAPASLPSEA